MPADYCHDRQQFGDYGQRNKRAKAEKMLTL